MNLQVSSLELHYIIKELSFLSEAKIEKIRSHQDAFSLELYIPTVGKKYLYIQQPDLLCITDERPTIPSVPSELLRNLRSNITGGRILSIEQYSFDRIVVLSLSTKNQEYKLVIELFHQGNIVLCDKDYKVISALQFKRWTSDRAILPGKIYDFPPVKQKPNALSIEELQKTCLSSQRESISHVLAVELSFGAQYGEEILNEAGIDKQKDPKKLSIEEINSLQQSIQQIFTRSSSAITKNKHAYPFALTSVSIDDATQQKSFNEAVYQTIRDRLQIEQVKEVKISPKEKKLVKIIAMQKKQLEKLESQAIQNQEKGEFIYTNYASFTKVLTSKNQEIGINIDELEIKEKQKHTLIIEAKND